MKFFVSIVTLGWLLLAPGWADPAVPTKAPAASVPVAPAKPLSSIQRQIATLLQGKKAVEQVRAELKEKEAKLEALRTGKGLPAKGSAEEIEAMQKEVDEARAGLARNEADLKENLVGVAGLDAREIASTNVADLGLELKEVLQPLLRSAKDLVADQRKIAETQTLLEQRRQLLKKYDAALSNLETVSAAMPTTAGGKDLRDMLVEERKELETERAHLPVEIANLEREFADLQQNRKPWTAYAADLLRDSVLRRLWNLLLAGLAFTLVLTLCRVAHRWVARKGWIRKSGISVFVLRLANVFYYLFSALSAGLSAFLVLYASGDWFLLTLAMLALAGLLLAGRHTLPKLYEQVKLLLNLGSCREGERVMYRDLPWMVKKINFYCDLVNPSLTGGTLRLTLRDVIPLHSRPYDRKERWFPSEEGDWVQLQDGMVAKVVLQTPEYVQVVPNGGSYKSYPTVDFLKQHPRNLSHGFRVQSVFGLSYDHLREAYAEIPLAIETRVRKDLATLMNREDVVHCQVMVAHAGQSSLDLMVIVDFRGDAAVRYAELERVIQRACIAEAGEQKWTIPFPQLTVHTDSVPSAGKS